jgi:hypothetical protein
VPAVPSLRWHGPVDPSRPVVRPDCSHMLLMSHTAQHNLPVGLRGPEVAVATVKSRSVNCAVLSMA